jgi:hypothetical protein
MRTHGIKTFKIGATSFTTIKTVDTNEDVNPLYDAGDVDTDETLVGVGMGRNTFSITLSDPIQAQAMKASAAANIVFNGVDATSTANVLVTLVNAKIFSRSNRLGHNQVGQITLTGRCDSITVAAPP